MPYPGIIDSSLHQKRFLECFAASGGRVSQGSRWAKVSRNAHYIWMKEDPTYPARFHDATAKAARILEDECVRRAHEGVRRAIRYKGKIVSWEHEYSDTLMLALLRAYMPDKFRDRQSVEHSGPGGSAIPSTLTVEFVRPGEAADLSRVIDVSPATPMQAQTALPAATAPQNGPPPIEVQFTGSSTAGQQEPAQGTTAPTAAEAALLAEITKLRREGKRLRTRLGLPHDAVVSEDSEAIER